MRCVWLLKNYEVLASVCGSIYASKFVSEENGILLKFQTYGKRKV